jgi:hypothetical protein
MFHAAVLSEVPVKSSSKIGLPQPAVVCEGVGEGGRVVEGGVEGGVVGGRVVGGVVCDGVDGELGGAEPVGELVGVPGGGVVVAGVPGAWWLVGRVGPQAASARLRAASTAMQVRCVADGLDITRLRNNGGQLSCDADHIVGGQCNRQQ